MMICPDRVIGIDDLMVFGVTVGWLPMDWFGIWGIVFLEVFISWQ
jgi:hypothetical protein